jgi:hypothetical protein
LGVARFSARSQEMGHETIQEICSALESTDLDRARQLLEQEYPFELTAPVRRSHSVADPMLSLDTLLGLGGTLLFQPF